MTDDNRHSKYSIPAIDVLPSNPLDSPKHQIRHTVDCFRSRNSPRSPRLSDKASTKSDVGFGDRFAFLKSKQAVPTAYRPFPGLIDIIPRSGTANSFAAREHSPLLLCDEYDPNESFTSSVHLDGYNSRQNALLVPLICVTPNTRVIDTGYHNFWVALEVTAVLQRPENEHRSSSEGITSQSQKASHSEFGEMSQENGSTALF